MKISLVLSTVDRLEQIRIFFDSLVSQTYRNFEVIAVDQNETCSVEDLCKEYSDKFPINHFYIKKRGLSLARNFGLRYAKGEVLAFPDDDCEYPPHLLEKVVEILTQNVDIDAVTGITIDKNTGQPSVNKFDSQPGFINISNIFRRSTSASMFLRKELVENVGKFDERLGAGTEFGCAEEMDYLLRALYSQYKIFYQPNIFVFHPDPMKNYDSKSIHRVYLYGKGLGGLFKKHIYTNKKLPIFMQMLFHIIKPIVGFFIYAVIGRKKSAYYLQAFRGRLCGLIYFPCDQMEDDA